MIKRFMEKGWRSVVAILLFIVFWESIVRILNIEEWLLPAPSAIVQELFAVWPTFHPHLLSTMLLVVLGFLIGALFGLTVAMVLHSFDKVRETIYPFLILDTHVRNYSVKKISSIIIHCKSVPKFFYISYNLLNV